MKQGGHGGRARYILKDTLKYLPLYGWYLGYVSGCGQWEGLVCHTLVLRLVPKLS